MIPYKRFLDENSQLSAERIAENLGLENPAFPLTRLVINGLNSLRFSYYGSLLIPSKEFANIFEQLPEGSREYLLNQVHLYEPTIVKERPKSFPLRRVGRDLTLDDLLSDGVIGSRTKEYYAPAEGKTSEEKVQGIQRHMLQAADFVETLPENPSLKPAYLIGFENLLNLTTFLAYAAFNTQIEGDVNRYYAQRGRIDTRMEELVRDDFFWPYFKQAVKMAAFGYLFALVGHFEGAKAAAKKLKEDSFMFSDALHFFVEEMLQYRLREGDKLESIIIHTLNFLNSNEIAKKGQKLNFYSVFWGGSYVAPIMAAMSSLARKTVDEFDYLQFSSHQIKVYRQAFIKALRTDVQETSVLRRKLGDQMRLAELRGRIAGRMLNYAKTEVPIFATRNLKNKYNVVISDDNIGTGLTMYFNYMLPTFLDNINSKKHVIVSPVAAYHSFYTNAPAVHNSGFEYHAQELLKLPDNEFVMQTIELLGHPRDFFPPTFIAQDPRWFAIHREQVIQERRLVG